MQLQNYGFSTGFPQGIPWVTQQEADTFFPPPGLPTLLFIRGTDTFVSKHLDGLQRVVTEVYRYTEIKPEPPKETAYATKDDLAEFARGLHAELEPLLRLLNNQQGGQNNGILGTVHADTAAAGRAVPAESAGAAGYAGSVRRTGGNDTAV